MDDQRLLLHPVRLRIVNAVLDGRDFTTAELCERLGDVSKATVYRQLAELVTGDFVHVVAEERVRGAVRRTYRLTSRRPLLTDDDFSKLTSDGQRQLFSNLATTMLAEFGRYVAEPGYVPEATSYRQFALWLTDTERDELSRELAAVIDRFAQAAPSEERRRHMLTAVLFPAGR